MVKRDQKRSRRFDFAHEQIRELILLMREPGIHGEVGEIPAEDFLELIRVKQPRIGGANDG
jgi:hypothetical protein